jgi:hypothetical protein
MASRPLKRRVHQAIEYDSADAAAPASPPRAAIIQRKKQSPLKKIVLPEIPAPDGWRQVYEEITVMRAKRDAPVDTMGTEALGDRSADPKTFRYDRIVRQCRLTGQQKSV